MSAEQTENPLRFCFWFGDVDARPFALFRIGLGLTLLHDLFNLLPDLRAFFSDEGFLPRSVAREWWTWTVLDYFGSMPVVITFFLVGLVAVAAFTLGFRTRMAAAVSWLFLITFHHRNYFITDGGDDLVRILMFWSIFADLGARYSVDARLQGKTTDTIRAFAPRLLQAHIALLYGIASYYKYKSGWMHENTIFFSLQHQGFLRPLGSLLGGYPSLCMLLTRSVLLMEFLFPFMAMAPILPKVTRAIAIALGISIQFGILLTMRVGIFTETMLVVLIMWMQPEWLDFVEAKVQHALSMSGPANSPKTMGSTKIVPAVLGLYALLAGQFIVSYWPQFLGTHLRLPSVVEKESALISLLQPMGLFDVVYSLSRWEAHGKLSDGSQVEVLSIVAPGATPRAPAFTFSRWYKFTIKGREHPYAFAELGAFLCREYNAQTEGPKLVAFTLIDQTSSPRDQAGKVSDVKSITLWEQSCQSAAI